MKWVWFFRSCCQENLFLLDNSDSDAVLCLKLLFSTATENCSVSQLFEGMFSSFYYQHVVVVPLLFYPVLMCSLWVMFKVKMLRSIHFIKFWGWDGFGSAEDFSEMLSAQLFRCSTAINSIYWFLPPLVFGAFKIILDFPCKMLFGKWQFGIATAEAVATSWCSFPALFFVLLYAFLTF